ncbi:chemotaxis protein methyltransferase [Bordetella trematum]|nr:chemotaxis protein methyltransferase [Bordetella trematum]
MSTIQGGQPPAGERQFDFRDADFSRVRRMIYAHAGIALGEHKREMVYSRLARRLRAQGRQEFAAYLDELERDSASPEWEHFINALTTNLTAFFREAHHFPILAEFARQRPGRCRSGAARPRPAKNRTPSP